MLDELRGFVPQPPALPETIAIAQVTREFHHEVAHRQAFAAHCDWYKKTAAEHRQELRAMRREINLFRWFGRR
jgi:hypothetical protein